MKPGSQYLSEMDRSRAVADITPERLNTYIDAIVDSAGKAAAQKVLLSHPAIFGAYCFNLRIKDYQADVLWHAHKEKRLIILLPGMHGKSTLIGMVLLLYEICRNRNIRVCLMMKTDQTASDYALLLQDILDPANSPYPRLHAVFGPFRGNRWTTKAMNFHGRQIASDAPTIRFIGAKPSAVGKGCDWLIADDLVTTDNSESETERKALSTWFNTVAQTMPRNLYDHDLETGWLRVPATIDWPRTPVNVEELLKELGYDLDSKLPPRELVERLELGRPDEYEKITLCGTVFHVEDLWMEKAGDVEDAVMGKLSEAADPTYKLLYYDCFRDEAETEALWPEHRPIEWLHRERISMGEEEFNKRERNKPINELNVALKAAWIVGGTFQGIHYQGCLDGEHTRGRYKDGFLKVLGVDPASGRRGRRSSWTAFCLIAVDPSQLRNEDEDPDIWVVDVFRAQIGHDETLDTIFDGNDRRAVKLPGFYREYAYDLCAIETNDKQISLVENRRVRAFNLQHPGTVTGFDTEKAKMDAKEGLRSLDRAFMDSRIHIPNATPSDGEHFRRFVQELKRFPDGQVDMVMAFLIAVRKMRENLRVTDGFYLEGYNAGMWITNPHFADDRELPPEEKKPRLVMPNDPRPKREVPAPVLSPPARKPIVVSLRRR